AASTRPRTANHRWRLVTVRSASARHLPTEPVEDPAARREIVENPQIGPGAKERAEKTLPIRSKRETQARVERRGEGEVVAERADDADRAARGVDGDHLHRSIVGSPD